MVSVSRAISARLVREAIVPFLRVGRPFICEAALLKRGYRGRDGSALNRDAVAPADEGRGDWEGELVSKAIRAVAEATGLASEPERPKARKGTGRKKGG